jgi:hypothetical protein
MIRMACSVETVSIALMAVSSRAGRSNSSSALPVETGRRRW